MVLALSRFKVANGYRDAYIDAMFPAKDKQVAYGSIFPTEVDLLRFKLTQQQIIGLAPIVDTTS